MARAMIAVLLAVGCASTETPEPVAPGLALSQFAYGQAFLAQAPPPENAGTHLSVDVIRCEGSLRSGYTTTKGFVRNEGTTAVHYVTVELRWVDRGGRVIDTGWTYAVGSEYLKPGESSLFEYSTSAPGVSGCRASLGEWEEAA